MIMDFN